MLEIRGQVMHMHKVLPHLIVSNTSKDSKSFRLESINYSKDDKKEWKELVHMHYLTPNVHKDGEPVSLLACHAGSDGYWKASDGVSYAQVLSRKLGVTVYAPTGLFIYGGLGFYKTSDGKGMHAYFPWN